MTVRAGPAGSRPGAHMAGDVVEDVARDIAGLGLSAAAMRRATALLGGGARASRDRPAIAAVAVPRVLANGLRELDRFLSVLIDDVASRICPAGLDRARFARQSNTPNKLRRINAALGLASPDHERLRAIGRTRDRLFHSAPPSYAGAVPVPAWLHTGGIVQPLRDRRARTADLITDLHDVCALYDRLSAELVRACEAHLAAH